MLSSARPIRHHFNNSELAGVRSVQAPSGNAAGVFAAESGEFLGCCTQPRGRYGN